MRGGHISEPCGCGSGSGCDCGCCEGTEPVTPRTIVNRPGLDALAYRIGTQSAFLETMKARLSSAAYPALAGLTIREADDPSIALLDAWAVVADVLTFYQERIANEGYLRTATERRSVLELARLVGYAPRPGVAASVYLAFTLEEKPRPILPAGSPAAPVSASQEQPEIVVPAGARAQSIPGPGETQQAFETSDDLVARAAWNLLQVRLTQPQQPATFFTAEGKPQPGTLPLYLKGITTNLKPNDPLLLGSGAGTPSLFRVRTVDADAARDRTRVGIEAWWPPASSSTSSQVTAAASPETVAVAEVLPDVLGRFSDLEALNIASGATTHRVLALLAPLKASLDAGAGEPELRVQAEELLPQLQEELRAAEAIRAIRLAPWIAGLVAELKEALADTPVDTSLNLSVNPPTRTTTSLTKVLESLGKPPSVPPPGGLDRQARTLLAPGSDLAAKLLTVARPELRDTLYKAWANVPVVLGPDLKVCALRTRASVFGHNAPLELVRRQRDGVILGTKEWDLRRPATMPGEDVLIRLDPSKGGHGFQMQVSVSLDSKAAVTTGQLRQGDIASLDYPAAEETVKVKLVQGATDPGDLPFQVEVTFENRDVQVVLSANQPTGEKVEHFEVSGFGQQTRTVTVERIAAPIIGLTGELGPGESRALEVKGRIGDSSGDPEQDNVVFLDNAYPQLTPAGWIVLQRPESDPKVSPLVITTIDQVSEQSRAAYGLSGKTTRVVLGKPWLKANDTFAVIRGTAVYAQCEELTLAEVPIAQPVCGGTIELSAVYDGLQPGRWLIVSGERTNVGELDEKTKEVIVPVRGVPAAELVLLAGVSQDLQREAKTAAESGETRLEPVAGETTHSTLTLAAPLAYCYKRDTLTIYGNVAHATHGESRSEVLGSGDGAKALQSFPLKQPPLTYVSAPTTSGIASTLQVRVNDILWHEAESLAGLGPADRKYTLRTDDGGQTAVVFGNGERGARLPTGSDNVRAAYRNGIGKAGNVKAGQISQLASRPLGVKDVINPLPATGGGDRESRDQARRNAPLAVLALDRLISVQDYEDFTRTFAGVGKASAARLSDGRVQLVHITLAGEDDIPIAPDSDLLANLAKSLRRFGDPRQPLRLELRRRTFLVVQAEVKLLPDYFWEAVEPKIRAAMLDAFGFARRDLGQDALLSEVYATIQRVRGIDFLDVTLFASKDPEDLTAPLYEGTPPLDSDGTPLTGVPAPRLRARLAQVDGKGKIQPAELLYLTPEVADTLILKERKA